MKEKQQTNVNNEKKEEVITTKSTKLNPDSKTDLKNFVKDEETIRLLNQRNITRLLPIQVQTFDIIYKGEDIVAKDRTGSGKTIAFALPTILKLREQKKFKGDRTTKFMVVLPTRELAIQVKDQIDSLRYKKQNDFSVVAVYGGAGIQDQLYSLSRGADIIVGTPGRLIDFLDRGSINVSHLQVICLDEADEMLNIGFKEDIQKIFYYIQKANKNRVQCLMFSATIPDWIWRISDMYQSKTRKFIDMLKDGYTKTSKTVQHYCLRASEDTKQCYIGGLIEYLFQGGTTGKIIIFCETKRQVQRIGNSGMIPVAVQMLHGDFKQFQREKVFRKFKNGQAECLIATNVAARGLDFPQIDLIIQMQPPNTVDAYIHRSGRTGRAGKMGMCVTLYSHKEQYLMQKIEYDAKLQFIHISPKQLTVAQKSTQPYRQWRGSENNNYSGGNSYGYGRSNSYVGGPSSHGGGRGKYVDVNSDVSRNYNQQPNYENSSNNYYNSGSSGNGYGNTGGSKYYNSSLGNGNGGSYNSNTYTNSSYNNNNSNTNNNYQKSSSLKSDDKWARGKTTGQSNDDKQN